MSQGWVQMVGRTGCHPCCVLHPWELWLWISCLCNNSGGTWQSTAPGPTGRYPIDNHSCFPRVLDTCVLNDCLFSVSLTPRSPNSAWGLSKGLLLLSSFWG